MAELDKKTLNEAEAEVVTGGTQTEDTAQDNADENELVKNTYTYEGTKKRDLFKRRP